MAVVLRTRRYYLDSMRASFLLDPRIPIFTDSPSTWIAPPMGDWVSRHLWSSSSKSGFPYTWDNRQHHSPVARIPIRKCCNGICCRSGTRVPMHHFYKGGVVAAMDGKGGIGSSITLNRSAPSMDCWVSKVKSSWGEPPYSSPKFNHAMSVPGFLARSYPSISIWKTWSLMGWNSHIIRDHCKRMLWPN